MYRKFSVFAATLSLLGLIASSANSQTVTNTAVVRIPAAVVIGKFVEAPAVTINISATWYVKSGIQVGQYAFNSGIDANALSNTAYIATPNFAVSDGVYHAWGRTTYKGKWGCMEFWADQDSRRVKITFKPDRGLLVVLGQGTMADDATFMIAN